jgi:hypothetical protein
MGASFDDWIRGCATFIVGLLAIFACAWILQALGVTIPRPVARVVGLVIMVVLMRLILSQIFD